MSLMTNTSITYSQILTILRVARGNLSQTELADRIGTNRIIISRYENGLNFSDRDRERLETFFDVDFDDPDLHKSIAYLIGAAAKPEPSNTISIQGKLYKIAT